MRLPIESAAGPLPRRVRDRGGAGGASGDERMCAGSKLRERSPLPPIGVALAGLDIDAAVVSFWCTSRTGNGDQTGGPSFAVATARGARWLRSRGGRRGSGG